jgi:hypothetical protein
VSLATTALAAALLVACGDDRSTGYDERVEAEFLQACTSATPEPVCRCLYDRIVDEVPFERFEEVDRRLSDPDALPADIEALAVRCATEDAVDE